MATYFDRYEVLREIDRSNDIVWECYDPKFKRRVAIKELVCRPGMSPNDVSIRRERFQREAQACAALSHPNIVQVYDVGQTPDGRDFLVQEFLEGETLGAAASKGRCHFFSETSRILHELLSALGHVHENGIVHRDIKPANICILQSGQVKLFDFGIAQVATASTLTRTGEVWASARYASPEQLVGKPVDARSDLFSVGIIACELISGLHPFAPLPPLATDLENQNAIVAGIMFRDATISPFMPPAVHSFMERALQKEPRDRFQTASEMASALPDSLPQAIQKANTVQAAGQIQQINLGPAAQLTPTAPRASFAQAAKAPVPATSFTAPYVATPRGSNAMARVGSPLPRAQTQGQGPDADRLRRARHVFWCTAVVGPALAIPLPFLRGPACLVGLLGAAILYIRFDDLRRKLAFPLAAISVILPFLSNPRERFVPVVDYGGRSHVITPTKKPVQGAKAAAKAPGSAPKAHPPRTRTVRADIPSQPIAKRVGPSSAPRRNQAKPKDEHPSLLGNSRLGAGGDATEGDAAGGTSLNSGSQLGGE